MNRLDLSTDNRSLDFNTFDVGPVPAQKDREYELQREAGIEPTANFAGIRAQLAKAQSDEEMDLVYKSAEDSIAAGAPVDLVSKYVEDYKPAMYADDIDVSLEREAATKAVERAYNDNEQTAINAVNNALTTEELDMLQKQEIIETWRRANIDRIESNNNWTRFGKNILLGSAAGFFKTPEDTAKDIAAAEHVGSALSRYLMPVIGAQALDQDVFPAGKKSAFEFSSITTRERQRKNIWDYAKNHSQKELEEYLSQVSDYMWNKSGVGTSTILAFMEEFNENPNVWNDFFGVFEAATPVIRGINNSIRLSKGAGNVKKAAAEIVQGVKDKDPEMIVKEAITPNALQPFQGSDIVSYSRKVEGQIADLLADEDAMKIATNLRADRVMSETELLANKQFAKEEFLTKYGKEGIQEADIAGIDLVEDINGSTLASFDVGIGVDGTHAMDYATAQFKAHKLGLPDDSYIIHRGDGEGYYLRYVTPLKDRVFTPTNAKQEFKAMGLTRMFAGAAIRTGKEAHARGVQATRLKTSFLAHADKMFGENLRKLSAEGKDQLKALFIKGQQANEQKGKWFTLDELKDFDMPKEVIEAYFSFKKLSDIDYFTENALYHRKLSSQGYKLFKGDVIGIEQDIASLSDDAFNRMRIKVGDKILDTSTMSLDDFKKTYKDSGATLVKGHGIGIARDNLEYTHVLYSSSDSMSQPLPKFLLPYQEGGRREYTYGTMFAKCGRKFVGRDGVYNGIPKTLKAGTDRKEMDLYVKEVNEAIDIARAVRDKTIDVAEAQARISRAGWKKFDAETWEDLNQMLSTEDNPKGLIDIDYKASVVADGEKFIYNEKTGGAGLRSIEQDISETDDALFELARARDRYFDSRGRILDGVNGNKTPIKSIFEIYDTTLARAARTNTIGEMSQWYAKEFNRNFLQYIDTSKYSLTGKSQLDILRYAPLLDINKAPREYRDGIRAAMRFRDRFEILSQAQSPLDKYISRVLTSTANSIADHIPGFNRSDKALEKLAKAKPDKFATAVGFHAAMGWFNSKQFFKQALGTLNTLALAPVRSTQALLAMPFIRLGYRYKDNNKIVKSFADACTRLIGISSEDFNGILKYMDEYASLHSTSFQVGMSEEHANWIRRSTVGRISTFFADAGNNLNYLTADIAAYMSKKGKSFKEIAAYADDLYLNMTRADISKFQASAGVISQWLTYPTRATEALFNNRLTKTQRARLALSQLAMWGVVGTLGSEALGFNAYKFLTEDADIPDNVAKTITDGTITNLARAYGYDMQEGIGIGDIVKNNIAIFNEELSQAEISIPALQVRSQLSAVWNMFKEAVAPDTDERNIYTWLKNRAADKSAPSSIRTYANSALALAVGKMYNSKRDIIDEDKDVKDVVMSLLGFTEMDRTEDFINKVVLKDANEAVEEAVQRLEPYVKQLVDIDELHLYEDPIRRSEEYDRLWNRYYIDRAAEMEALKQIYPDGRVHRKLSQRLNSMFAAPVKSSDVSTQKVYMETGYDKIVKQYLKGYNFNGNDK